MYLVRHSSYSLRTMEIVDVDVPHVVNHLWETSEFIKQHGLSKNGILVEPLDVCRLDPGGMLNMKEKWKVFVLDGCTFEIQLSKLSWVLMRVKRAKPRIPGCRRCGMFMCNVIVSEKMWVKLIAKLESLQSSDETLHAQISDYEIKEKLESGGHVIFPEIPRE